MKRNWMVAGLALSASMVLLPRPPAASVVSASLDQTSIAESPDVAWYVQRFGVSAEEARRRFELQDVAGVLDEALATNEAASFAGAWIEHEPQFRVVALFTFGGDETLRQYTDGTPLEGIAEAGSAKYTLAELQDHQRRVMVLHMSLRGLEDFESRISAQMNRLEILTATPEAYAAVTVLLGELPASVVTVQVPELSRAVANIYGGLPLGGNGCTSGFTIEVNSGTTKGITTAGHCGDSASYSGINLPWAYEQYYGNTDAQWHTTVGHINRNWVWDGIYDGSTPYYRLITSKRHRNNQMLESTVCKYGRNTGFGCGILTNKSLDPSDNCIPASTATWMYAAGGDTNLSEAGDSGGPVFSINSAYGTMSCQTGNDMIYMAQNYLTSIGVHVWTG
jgi:streptogrisin C